MSDSASPEKKDDADKITAEKVATEKIYVRRSSGLVRAVSSRQALFANLVSMGAMGPVLYILYAVYTAPSGDIPVTVFVGLAIVLSAAYVYWMLSTSMPRTGGDYIWTSRILNPFLGFIESSMILFVMITSFVSYDIYLSVTTGFSYMFVNFGFLAKNQGLINIGTSLISNQPVVLGVTVVIALLIMGIMFLPIKRVIQVLVGFFFVTVAIFLVYVGLLLSAGSSGFIANFNALSANSSAYQSVVAANPNVSYDVQGTLFIGLIFIMLSYIGYVNSSYFAGEVSGNPFRSQGLAIFASPIIYSVILFMNYFIQFNTYGHQFLVSATSLFYSGSSVLPSFGLPAGVNFPAGVFLVNFLTSNPYLSSLVALGLGLQFVAWGLVFYLVPTRYIFAWSFDRILPVRLSATSKSGVPYYAVGIYGVLTIIFVILAVYTSILSFYAYAIFGFYLSTTIVLLAGAVFPFRKKELFEASHRYVKARVAGIPVISIVASVGALFTIITMIVTVLPAYTGYAFRWDYFSPIVIVLVVAAITYFVSYYYNKSKGLPVDLVGKELPPL
jgi:amino acid transporter